MASRHSVPFLTQVDARAAVRGSRDPLSLVPIWSAFGRRVVGNLTTASTSLRGFTTLLLGYYCADRVLEKDADQTPLSVFLRVEQLISYSRVIRNPKDTDFRGSERVKKRLEESSRITLSAEPRYQTLSDQKTYGLWGLYSVASRTSGFLLPDRPSLTPEATELVERQYMHKLSRAGLGGATGLLLAVGPTKKDLDLQRGASELAHVLASIHSSAVNAAEREIYQRFLVDGGDEQNTEGFQRKLAELLGEVTTDNFGMTDLQRVIRLAEKQKKHEELVGRLSSIQRLEMLIVAAANLFGFLLRCDGRAVDNVERDLRRAWGRGLKTITPDITTAVEKEVDRIAQAPESATYLGQFGRHAFAGDWRAAAEGLIEFNSFVMKRRGGAAWIRREKGTIKVDYREEGADLASPRELEQGWRNTYFINALYGIKRAIAQN